MNKVLNFDRVAYPSQSAMLEVVLTAVLTEGIIGDHAVYIGHGSPEWVARHGNKLTYRRAVAHFPFLEEGNYRE